jgi:hypothetical protein
MITKLSPTSVMDIRRNNFVLRADCVSAPKGCQDNEVLPPGSEGYRSRALKVKDETPSGLAKP